MQKFINVLLSGLVILTAVSCASPALINEAGDANNAKAETLNAAAFTNKSLSTTSVNPAKAVDLGNGSVKFEVTLASGQAYVELFVRQNGIQNVAQAIATSEQPNGNGTSVYSFVKNGYQTGDAIEYRFYSYLPANPGVFTPGPAEQVWLNAVYGQMNNGGKIEIDVFKDAQVVGASYGGYGYYTNYGRDEQVGYGWYHFNAKGLFGFKLDQIPANATITKAAVVWYGTWNMSGGYASVYLNKVNDSASWEEMTVTWASTPASTFYKEVGITTGLCGADLTDLVANAVANHESEISLLVVAGNSNGGIASKESTTQRGAYLVVEWK